MDWNDLAQDRNIWPDFVNAVMKFGLLSNLWNFLTSCGNISGSRRTQLPGWSSSVRYCFTWISEDGFWFDRKSAELMKALRSGGVCKEKACHCTVECAARQCVAMKVRIA
jgi:hypothetical protein